ncbi:MAG: hypothetical protein K8H90_04555, partial [Thermoanaerobaculia bacterium]|nr:hypothetical protein [Thermoanaerobaculia bacterium]
MSVQRHRVRPGTYCDSVVLMQLQRALEGEPGVEQAAALMATPANREILENGAMWSDELAVHRPDDLLIVVRAGDSDAAEAALERIDDLLRQRAESRPTRHRYRSLAKALEDHPEAAWVAVSTPGAHAAPVAREALAAGRHVFLYSDNVSLDDEVELKKEAGRRGRLVLGPDCGTSILGGLGFGFSNRVRRGPIGLVGASGTGLQAVSCAVDTLGSGISQAIGTGGRDLSSRVAGRTTRQALELLSRDPDTKVLGLISKPPDPAVATDLIAYANSLGKPVVVGFVGGGSNQDLGRVELASSLARTAERLVAR